MARASGVTGRVSQDGRGAGNVATGLCGVVSTMGRATGGRDAGRDAGVTGTERRIAGRVASRGVGTDVIGAERAGSGRAIVVRGAGEVDGAGVACHAVQEGRA